MRSLHTYLLVFALLGALTACSDDTDTNTPTTTQDAGADDADASGDATLDADAVDTTETPCGPNLTCTGGDVCVGVCLCCGVDTGNPADQQEEFYCVPPDPECEGRPSECIDDEAITPNISSDTCQSTGDYTCYVGCA